MTHQSVHTTPCWLTIGSSVFTKCCCIFIGLILKRFVMSVTWEAFFNNRYYYYNYVIKWILSHSPDSYYVWLFLHNSQWVETSGEHQYVTRVLTLLRDTFWTVHHTSLQVRRICYFELDMGRRLAIFVRISRGLCVLRNLSSGKLQAMHETYTTFEFTLTSYIICLFCVIKLVTCWPLQSVLCI